MFFTALDWPKGSLAMAYRMLDHYLHSTLVDYACHIKANFMNLEATLDNWVRAAVWPKDAIGIAFVEQNSRARVRGLHVQRREHIARCRNEYSQA